MTAPLTAVAPAKLNLTLSVVGRRDDGYHLLDSLVAFADIGDRLTAEPADFLSLEIAGPQAAALAGAAPSDNLVLRAARALAEAAGATAGARLVLEKHLPVASGIGGGSADAGAALRLLVRLWGVDLPAARLEEIALDLGADVPVCLASRPAWMGGIGEELAPVADLPTDPPPGVVLVNPGMATPTGAVFRALGGRFSEAPARPARLGPALGDLVAAIRPLGNDLAAPAREVTPEIDPVLAALEDLEDTRYAALSGSGATCFALFDDRAAAEAAAERVRETAPAGWWIAAGALSGASADAP